MKVVMTVLARDEVDIVRAHLTFHLNAGVDFVIATDNRSEDGTTEILESFARDGCLHLIREPADDRRHGEWFTRMARLAASEFGADWVINSDADEFWWPRGDNLREVLANVPARYGIVGAPVRHFAPRPDDDGCFAERMTVRLSPRAPLNDPASSFRPFLKVVHRGDPSVTVSPGNHTLQGSTLRPLRGWYPIEVLHFPLRSSVQAEQKSVKWIAGTRAPRGAAVVHEGKPNIYHQRGYEAHGAGRFCEYWRTLAVDDDALARGVADGSLVIDTRLRDALRSLDVPGADGAAAIPRTPLHFPRPDVVDDAAYAVDIAVLGEANLVRLHRRLDGFEERLGRVERRTWPRIRRRVVKLARKG